MAAVTFGVAGAAAQDSVTLEEALDRAHRFNPTYLRALQEESLSEPERRRAFGAFLPSLELSTGTGAGFSRRTIAEDVFGNPVPNPEVRTAYTSQAQQAVSFSLTLFQGGSRFHDLRSAGAQAELRLSQGDLARVALRAAVTGAFLDAQEAQAMVEVEEALLVTRRRDLEATERLFALAEGGRADVLGARFEVRQQERAVEDAGGTLRQALSTLRTAMGDPGAVPQGVVPAELPFFDPGTVMVDELLAGALDGSPRLRREESNLTVARANLAASRAGRWPTLSLSGSTSRSAFAPDQDALFDLSPRDQTGGGLSLNLSVPVFRRFETSFQIAQAEVNAQNATETVRETRLQLEEDIRNAHLELETAYRAVRLEEESLELAEERVRIAREEYRLAGRTFDQLQEPIRAEAAARRQLLQARYAFARAHLALEEALGMPLETGAVGSADAPSSSSRR
ncbi:MAG: TolC family protein [Gemmatimonadota bacterium]